MIIYNSPHIVLNWYECLLFCKSYSKIFKKKQCQQFLCMQLKSLGSKTTLDPLTFDIVWTKKTWDIFQNMFCWVSQMKECQTCLEWYEGEWVNKDRVFKTSSQMYGLGHTDLYLYPFSLFSLWPLSLKWWLTSVHTVMKPVRSQVFFIPALLWKT